MGPEIPLNSNPNIYSISYTPWGGSAEGARSLSERHAVERRRPTRGRDCRFGRFPARTRCKWGRVPHRLPHSASPTPGSRPRFRTAAVRSTRPPGGSDRRHLGGGCVPFRPPAPSFAEIPTPFPLPFHPGRRGPPPWRILGTPSRAPHLSTSSSAAPVPPCCSS